MTDNKIKSKLFTKNATLCITILARHHINALPNTEPKTT